MEENRKLEVKRAAEAAEKAFKALEPDRQALQTIETERGDLLLRSVSTGTSSQTVRFLPR